MGDKWMVLMIYSLLLVVSLTKIGNAQSMIDCTIVYKYADQKKAIREQIWEEGWEWKIESDDNFQIARKTSTSAQFQSPLHDAKGKCTITFTNNFDQISTKVFSLADTVKNNRDTISIILEKFYNKILLKNMAGVQISGDVYFGVSGITDLADLKSGVQCYKCPPAAGGGYSFPSISKKGGKNYSIYVPNSRKGFREISFLSNNWYGKLIFKELKIE